MKKIIIFVILILFSITIVYAANTLLKSEEVSYDNNSSKGTYNNVQDTIDELYKKAKTASGEMDTLWQEPILNGAYPVLRDGLIPVTIDKDGNVKYANLYTRWYSYEEKKWANAVILKSNTSKSYTTGDTIDEADIESYFVWIPRYKYKIWDMGNYTKHYTVSELKDDNTYDFNYEDLFKNARIIDIVFEDKAKTKSNGNAVGAYLTHPAFTLGTEELNGIWVGKFETGNDNNNIIIKPNVKSMVNLNVHDIFMKAYNYKRDVFDSHMMKNTEWGAVAYLSHSAYGIGNEIRINNNSEYKTGYASASNTNQGIYAGESGNSTSGKTVLYNAPEGALASTTGNITGIYDMNGGAIEYMAGYVNGYGIKSSKEDINGSGFSDADLTQYKNYFDVYNGNSKIRTYNNRILGDATGEMGPFLYFKDSAGGFRAHNLWHSELSDFINDVFPWFGRGGAYNAGLMGGIFYFAVYSGAAQGALGFRVVLSIK